MNNEVNSENSITTVNDNKLDILFYQPREVTAEQISEIRNRFYNDVILNKGKVDDIFNILYDYFKEANFSVVEVEKMHDTFWPLFVKSGWEVLDRLENNTAADVIGHTIPFAVSQYINVKNKINDIFLREYFEEPKKLYDRVKEILLINNLPVSFNEVGKKILLSKFIAEINKKNTEADISRYDMILQVQKALFMDTDDEAEKRDIMRRFQDFIDLIVFFTNDSNVEKFIISYIDSRKFATTEKLDKRALNIIGFNLLQDYFSENNAVEDIIIFSDEIAKNKQNFSKWIEDPATLRSLLTWLKETEDKVEARKKLEDLLQKELGENALADIETALAIVNLDEFLNRNNYPGDDFVHYDETEEKFKWGV